jgi:hypothetical protein
MKAQMRLFLFGFLAAALVGIPPLKGATEPSKLELVPLFPTSAAPSVTFGGKIAGAPLLDLSQGTPRVIVAASEGSIAALDPTSGALLWKTVLPAESGETPLLISTPVQIDDKLVVAYQTVTGRGDWVNLKRVSQKLAVVDLKRGDIDPSFPIIDLAAEAPAADGSSTVKFDPTHAASRSALKHVRPSGHELGFVYVSFGNFSDIQPWHGWLFEIDMDAWKLHGPEKAVSGTLVTTPETACGKEGYNGSRGMVCGGGIWTPSGPTVVAEKDDFELIVPTGNGQIDLKRGDYANTLMRVRQGLAFDPECDAALCKAFDARNPSLPCIESCKNLFIPRLAPNDQPLRPANGNCDDKTFWECLSLSDYDLGANAPVKVDLSDGRSVLVQPGKDGGLYLVDANHLGRQYDRMQIVDICGTETDPCFIPWLGMIVTRPALAYIGKTPVVVVPTFEPDSAHPAGLIALKIVLKNGVPKFERFWQQPVPSRPDATKHFRRKPSLPVIAPFGKSKDLYAWVVDTGEPATLYGVRVKDGALVVEKPLLGSGIPMSSPLVFDDKIYIPSSPDGGIEAYRITDGIFPSAQEAEHAKLRSGVRQ